MTVRIIIGDALEQLRLLPDESAHCCVTSPPYYGLRDYGVAGQIGLEPSPDEYVAALLAVFREVRRVLRSDGTLWLNIGDSYAGSTIGGGNGSYSTLAGTHHADRTGVKSISYRKTGLKPKDLIGIPWMLAFALRDDGWWLRQDIIWSKPNPMPESVTDRCTKAHEYLFLLSKSERYRFDADAVREERADERACLDWEARKSRGAGSGNREMSRWAPEKAGAGIGANPGGRNKRSVWTVASEPFPEAHFATFPPTLIEPCILAGCAKGGAVLDPFGGAGTTGLVADRLGRDAVLIELSPEYAQMAERRIHGDAPLFADVTAHWMPLPAPPSPALHWSDCAINNAPAFEPGPCDCGGFTESAMQSSAKDCAAS